MSALVGQDSYSAVHYIYHVLSLIRDVESEPLSYRAVPSSSKFLVESGFDKLSGSLQSLM